MPTRWTGKNEPDNMLLPFLILHIFKSLKMFTVNDQSFWGSYVSRKTSFKFINDFPRALPPKSMLINPTHTLPQLSPHLPSSTTTFMKPQHWSEHPIYQSLIPTNNGKWMRKWSFPLSSQIKWNLDLLPRELLSIPCVMVP